MCLIINSCMRFQEFSQPLTEGRDAPLYHGMTLVKAASVFKTDTLPASWTHDIPSLGKVTGTSLTRNSRLKYGQGIVLVLDQTKLSRRFKIIPLDGQLMFYKQGASDRRQKEYNPFVTGPSPALAEEFLIGDIKNLSQYILEIQIAMPTGRAPLNQTEFDAIQAEVTNYANQHGIKVVIDPKIQQAIELGNRKKTVKRTAGANNKILFISMRNNNYVGLFLAKNAQEAEAFKSAAQTGNEENFYQRRAEDDYMYIDDFISEHEFPEIADKIYAMPLTKKFHTLWIDSINGQTPEQYVKDTD